MKNKKLLIAVSLIVVVAGYFIASAVYKSIEQNKLDAIAQENAAIFIRDHSIRLGSDMAPVKLVEFLDPECESCRSFHPFVKELMKKHEGKVQLVLRYAPFHQNSAFAIRILEAARLQNKYWETLDVLFQSQPQWGDHHNPQPELLWTFLPPLNLDIEKLKKDMMLPAITEIIKQDMADARKIGVRATPSFFVNGEAPASYGPAHLEHAVEKAIASQ